MATSSTHPSDSRFSVRNVEEDVYTITSGPYKSEELAPIPYGFGLVPEADRDVVATAFGLVVSQWCDANDDTLVKVMEVRGVSHDKKNWVLAAFGETQIPGDISRRIHSQLDGLGCSHYIDTNIVPSARVVNSYGNPYTSAICIRAPRTDYHKDLAELQAQEKKHQFRELVSKKGAVFGKFSDRPSTLARSTNKQKEPRATRLLRHNHENQFKADRALTTAERFVDNHGALHRVSASNDPPRRVSDTLSFGERLSNFFFFIDADSV